MLFNSLTKVVHISLKAPEIGTSRFSNPKLEPSQLFKENIYREAHTFLHQLHTFGHGHSHKKASQMHLLQVHPDNKNFPNRISFTLIS
jgi:hypothetical protein